MSFYSPEKFCTYLTVYHGSKLPPFYIGSGIITKIKYHNYNGSVKSKKYKDVWEYERVHNPQLFRTIILRKFFSRKNAQYHERKLQLSLNVVKSTMYINMSVAKDFGWFGMNTAKENSPVFGKRWNKTATQIENYKTAYSNRSEESINSMKAKQSAQRKGKLTNRKLQNIEKYIKIIDLYNSKPELKHGHKQGDGKILTYKRAFSKVYSTEFGFTPTGLYFFLTGKYELIDSYIKSKYGVALNVY